jgi:uncharacterized protein (TIGR02588 family)
MTTATKDRHSAAEWVTLALSVLVVGALVVVAIVEEARRPESGSSLEITFDKEGTVVRDGVYYIPYTVRNTGSVAITSAEIWFDVHEGERLVESAEVTVQNLPIQGTQEGIFVTTWAPETHPVTGRLESLQFP